MLDEGNLDHGVGDATDKIEEPPGKKIDDISRVYQNSNSEVNPQNRNYQVNYLMQVIQAMQNEMCVMKNEIKQLKASRGQSQDAAIGFHVQKENSNAITPVEYAQVKNRVSKEAVAEVPDRSDVSVFPDSESSLMSHVTKYSINGILLFNAYISYNIQMLH